MSKIFNVNGNCIRKLHYMVDLTQRLEQIKVMIEAGQYFTINRARQYGKTTMLRALADYLKKDYVVASMDFQRMSYANFESEQAFVMAFAGELADCVESLPEEVHEKLDIFAEGNAKNLTLLALFRVINRWCEQSEKGIVLMIDEVDSATNNQVFLDFLAQLRGCYINRDSKRAFQAVILTGVYDVRNIKRKIRPEEEHRTNSPWNIAADFLIDMNFSIKDIAGMLDEYENDHKTGMDVVRIAGLIYDYTSGYPFLVSRMCKLMDERITESVGFPDKGSAWTKAGVMEAVKLLLAEKNTLFESLVEKLNSYSKLRDLIYALLFNGRTIPYNPLNRIFETVLYNLFLSEEALFSNRTLSCGEETLIMREGKNSS